MSTSLREAVDLLVQLRGRTPRAPGRVSLDLRTPVGQLVIDNPAARHALTLGMMEDLGRAVMRLEEWPGAAFVLRSSTPEAFCSGGDLKQVRSTLQSRDAARAMCVAMTTVTDHLMALPQVSVCVVTGVAVGGGAELTTATDHRVFGASAWIQFKHAELGVGTGWGGARRLLHHVKSRVAVRWLTTAARIDAKLAQRVGYADIVAAGSPADAAQELLRPVLALPADGVRAVKRQVGAARQGLTDDDQLHAFLRSWGGTAHRRSLGLE